MNFIWIALILLSVIIGAATGRLADVVDAMLHSSGRAVEVAISLIGIMAFWLGIMKIAQKSGLVELFSKWVSPIVGKIFPDIPKNSPALTDISLNFSANALGLANAATPFGIKAMENLKKESEAGAYVTAARAGETQHYDGDVGWRGKKPSHPQEQESEAGGGDVATNSMCTFLAMNTAGFQLVPTTVLAILIAAGADSPTDIIVPTLVVTSGAFVSAILISKILQRFFK